MTATPGELTGTERAVLLVLMARARAVPNPELAVLGPALERPSREKLNRLGLIDSERVGSRYVHELTDRGWRMCRELLDAPPPARATGPAKALQTVLAGLGRYLQAADVSLADVFGALDTPPNADTVEDRIRAAYAKLAPRPGGWVPLRRLRAEVEAPRDAVDAALTALHRTPGVSVIPEENQKQLTDDDRAAAVLIGDRPKHLIAIEV
ncbi:hypothetical protein FK535_06585 [Mycolicibacterium sp. 018/SC-01/001]|uniref:hypothetical protein n=1 Tax=Mycolicibacterium sp. 018/SC-01/001 TaxID=2592069 RepID=UPI00117F6F90|nr:hypothetical protein [Mycolicibacterium sp. 018/SC-01/001]TRW86143.1 hypothetical protein FK535_06585 [Mycolicibacterium sp. 018/SC-01/001]